MCYQIATIWISFKKYLKRRHLSCLWVISGLALTLAPGHAFAFGGSFTTAYMKGLAKNLFIVFSVVIIWGLYKLIVTLIANKSSQKIVIGELSKASADGDLRRVIDLVAAGASINQVDSRGGTPIMYAIRNDQFPVVEFLIASGADLNVRTKNGSSCMDLARENASESLVAYLELTKQA